MMSCNYEQNKAFSLPAFQQLTEPFFYGMSTRNTLGQKPCSCWNEFSSRQNILPWKF